MRKLLVNGKQYFSELSHVLTPAERLNIDCRSRQASSDLKKTIYFSDLTQWDFLMKIDLYCRALSLILKCKCSIQIYNIKHMEAT